MIQNQKIALPYCGCQPRNLATLMDLYESNFLRLKRLAPRIETMSGGSISRVAGALDLHLLINERYKFTTEIVLTYRFQLQDGHGDEPNALVRIYHDAGTAHVLSCNRRHPLRHTCCQRGPTPTALEKKWELNRFLQRWLGYCLHQGHLFL